MRLFWVLGKKQAGLLCMAALCAFTLLLGMPPVIRQLSAQETAGVPRRLPVYSVQTDEKVLALTFDCAWENSDTDKLLALLSEFNVKATFFTTGDWCRRYPEDVKRLFSAGHAIENHSDQHPHVASIPTEKLRTDTDACNETITALTGSAPRYYRAPYGEYANAMLAVIEDELSLQVIQWDVDSRDWQKRSAEEMAASVIPAVQNGSILLFHNDTPNTPEALRLIIPALQKQGYRFVLLPELVRPIGTPTDHTGRQTG